MADPHSVIRMKTCTSGAEADSDSAIRTKSIKFDGKKANNGTRIRNQAPNKDFSINSGMRIH